MYSLDGKDLSRRSSILILSRVTQDDKVEAQLLELFPFAKQVPRSTSSKMPHDQHPAPPPPERPSLAAQKIQLRPPPAFSGLDPGSVDNFFFTFDNMKTQFAWTDDKAKLVLSTFLTETALDY